MLRLYRLGNYKKKICKKQNESLLFERCMYVLPYIRTFYRKLDP